VRQSNTTTALEVILLVASCITAAVTASPADSHLCSQDHIGMLDCSTAATFNAGHASAKQGSGKTPPSTTFCLLLQRTLQQQ
jgi:hypothetical protein